MDGEISKSAINHFLGSWFSPEQQLDHSLVMVNKELFRRPKNGQSHRNTAVPTLPGFPTRPIDRSHDDDKALQAFMVEEFVTPKLNRMAPRMAIMATPNFAKISPLHEQLVRNRHIVITEDPELHLVWIDNRVFIKPIPPYLTSHAFWQKYLASSFLSPFQQDVTEALQPAILGYLRSWTLLVRHESDYNIARDANLIPRNVQYAKFMRFIANFAHPLVDDDQVSPRYQYGQLRLSRLNLWAKVFLGRWQFKKVHWQYWQYFQTFYGPLLFIFAVFTVILSAMQVAVSAPEIWPAYSAASIWFSVVTLVVVAGTVLILVALFLTMSFREILYAIHAVRRKKDS